MGPEGDAADVCRLPEAVHAAEQLQREPQAEQDDGGHFHQLDDDEDRDQREHARPREHHEVAAEDARDGPARAHHGDPRAGAEGHLQQGGGQAAQQVEAEVARVAQPVLDVVTEDPQVEHVAQEMGPSAVEEHRREDGEPAEGGWHQSPGRHERQQFTVPERLLEQEHQRVGDDQGHGDDGRRP